ncbi:hypothetical protein LVJ94_42000 [Pendulispora rubella]|uniref:Dickkopf N-terminal cysteine-rich domain-containing protein n=1 Tax=Pendulispora rubella TaxID=2741070 RepID=A0ABZ2L2J8_9BACT
MWVRLVLGTAFAAIGLLACSSSDSNTDKGGDGGGGDSVITAESACANYAQSRCAEVNGCTPRAFNANYADMNACLTRIQAVCKTSLAAPGTGKTAAKVDECAKSLKPDQCDRVRYNQPPEACKVSVGTLDDGAPCGDPSQCKGRYCKKAEGSTCGVCATVGQSGAVCDGDEACDEGFLCSAGKCAKICAENETCEGDNRVCGNLHMLDRDTKKCIPRLGEGQACSSAKRCSIADSLYCNENTRVCTRFEYVGVGQACGTNEQTKVFTGCRASSCSEQTPKTCLADLPEGAKCDAKGGAACALPGVCENGVCKKPDPANCK